MVNRTHKILFASLLLFTSTAIWVGVKVYDSSDDGFYRIPSLGTPRLKPHPTEEKQVLLNDPAMSKNWGLMGTGGTSDISANEAWKITQGSRDIRVAVIDTGIDINHPDIKANLWVNAGETGFDSKGRDKATNGVDDDGNGFIDDVHGWNFVQNNNQLTDNHGHGTHVAGIVGAEGGNGIGISGVSPKVSLMILKYFDPKSNGNDNLKNTIKAIQYAVKMNANIINYSGGGLDYSKDEFSAVQEAKDKGILFVAAAGNEYSNSDKSHYYPANYGLDNIISVTAINPAAEVLKSSNFGVKSVHIAAPGENIFSTLPNNRYGVMTGTSQATAFVSGVAALIMADNREFNYLQVKNQILRTADQRSIVLRGKTQTAGRLNSFRALAIQSSLPITGIVTAAGSSPSPKFSSTTMEPSLGRTNQDQLAVIGSIISEIKKSAPQKAN